MEKKYFRTHFSPCTTTHKTDFSQENRAKFRCKKGKLRERFSRDREINTRHFFCFIRYTHKNRWFSLKIFIFEEKTVATEKLAKWIHTVPIKYNNKYFIVSPTFFSHFLFYLFIFFLCFGLAVWDFVFIYLSFEWRFLFVIFFTYKLYAYDKRAFLIVLALD